MRIWPGTAWVSIIARMSPAVASRSRVVHDEVSEPFGDALAQSRLVDELRVGRGSNHEGVGTAIPAAVSSPWLAPLPPADGTSARERSAIGVVSGDVATSPVI